MSRRETEDAAICRVCLALMYALFAHRWFQAWVHPSLPVHPNPGRHSRDKLQASLYGRPQVEQQQDCRPVVGALVMRFSRKVDVGAAHAAQLAALLDGTPPGHEWHVGGNGSAGMATATVMWDWRWHREVHGATRLNAEAIMLPEAQAGHGDLDTCKLCCAPRTAIAGACAYVQARREMNTATHPSSLVTCTATGTSAGSLTRCSTGSESSKECP